MYRKIFATVVLSVALAFSALPPASAMTMDTAGTYFLNSVCPGRAKVVALNRAVFRNKANFTGKQMHGKRLRQARRAITAVKAAELNAVRRLRNPPSAWPSDEVATNAARVANTLARESIVLSNLRSRAGKRFKNYWVKVFIPANQAFASASRTARASLGLPTGPAAGC